VGQCDYSATYENVNVIPLFPFISHYIHYRPPSRPNPGSVLSGYDTRLMTEEGPKKIKNKINFFCNNLIM